MRLTKVNPFATICKYTVFTSTSLKEFTTPQQLLRRPVRGEIPHPQSALQGRRKETSFFLLSVLTRLRSALGVWLWRLSSLFRGTY